MRQEISNELAAMARKMLVTQTDLIKVYLEEFCEVNKVSEKDLKDIFVIEHYPAESSIRVVSREDDSVKIGCKYLYTPTDISFVVFGEYHVDKDKYQKTSSYLKTFRHETVL